MPPCHTNVILHSLPPSSEARRPLNERETETRTGLFDTVNQRLSHTHCEPIKTLNGCSSRPACQRPALFQLLLMFAQVVTDDIFPRRADGEAFSMRATSPRRWVMNKRRESASHVLLVKKDAAVKSVEMLIYSLWIWITAAAEISWVCVCDSDTNESSNCVCCYFTRCTTKKITQTEGGHRDKSRDLGPLATKMHSEFLSDH